jgi:hypothetical protein
MTASHALSQLSYGPLGGTRSLARQRDKGEQLFRHPCRLRSGGTNAGDAGVLSGAARPPNADCRSRIAACGALRRPDNLTGNCVETYPRKLASEGTSASRAMAQQQQRYRVIEKIASGGMAEVFRAESAGLEGFKKTVAIKRVLPHLSEKKQFIGMFLDEARLSAHLSHSNCVQVFDIGVGDNTYFIVMEYVDGSDLKGIIEHSRKVGRSIPIEEACLVCVRICEGLSYAHELVDGRGPEHADRSSRHVSAERAAYQVR